LCSLSCFWALALRFFCLRSGRPDEFMKKVAKNVAQPIFCQNQFMIISCHFEVSFNISLLILCRSNSGWLCRWICDKYRRKCCPNHFCQN
jgi:hypothetical protein